MVAVAVGVGFLRQYLDEAMTQQKVRLVVVVFGMAAVVIMERVRVENPRLDGIQKPVGVVNSKQISQTQKDIMTVEHLQ